MVQMEHLDKVKERAREYMVQENLSLEKATLKSINSYEFGSLEIIEISYLLDESVHTVNRILTKAIHNVKHPTISKTLKLYIDS